MVAYVLKIYNSNLFFSNTDFLKYITFSPRYLLCTRMIISPKIGKSLAFFRDWLRQYTFDSLKIGEIHTFFTVAFFKMCVFFKIGCVNAHLFCRSIFFPAYFLKCAIFCNRFHKFAKNLQISNFFCHWLLKNGNFSKLIFFF